MVDSRNDDTVSRAEPVGTIAEEKFDAARDDRIEIDAVGVVHRCSMTGRVLDEHPSCESRRDLQIYMSTLPLRPCRRRRSNSLMNQLR